MSDDDILLAKVLASVRLEVILPMQIRVSKILNGIVTDTHIFELSLGASISEVQAEVTSVCRQWKGKFPVGCQFIVERLQ